MLQIGLPMEGTPSYRIEVGEAEMVGDLAVLDGKVYTFKKSHNRWRAIDNQDAAQTRLERTRQGLKSVFVKPTPHQMIEDGEGEKVTPHLAILDDKVYFFKSSAAKWKLMADQEQGLRRVERARTGKKVVPYRPPEPTPTERVAAGDGERVGEDLVILDGKVYFFKSSAKKWRPMDDQDAAWRRVERTRQGDPKWMPSASTAAAARSGRIQRKAVAALLPYLMTVDLQILLDEFGEKVQDILAGMEEDKQIVVESEPIVTVKRIIGTPSERINHNEADIQGNMAMLDGHVYHQTSKDGWHHYPNQERAKDLFHHRKNHQPLTALEQVDVRMPRRFLGMDLAWQPAYSDTCPFCDNDPAPGCYCLHCDRYYLDHLLPFVPPIQTLSAELPPKVGHLEAIRRTGGKTFVFMCDCGRKVERIYNNIKDNHAACCDACASPLKALDARRQRLAETNFKWAITYAKKVGKRYRISEDEAESLGTVVFVKVIASYDREEDDDNSVRGYCSIRMRGQFYREFQRERRLPFHNYEAEHFESLALDHRQPIGNDNLRDMLRSYKVPGHQAALLSLIGMHGYGINHVSQKFGLDENKVNSMYKSAIESVRYNSKVV